MTEPMTGGSCSEVVERLLHNVITGVIVWQSGARHSRLLVGNPTYLQAAQCQTQLDPEYDGMTLCMSMSMSMSMSMNMSTSMSKSKSMGMSMNMNVSKCMSMSIRQSHLLDSCPNPTRSYLPS